MPAFFSDNNTLVLPEVPHSDDQRYEPVGIGKALSVEIAHIAFGNIRDRWGKAEALVSSWARTGETAKPGPRVINAMRNNISVFEHLSNFGAAQYGHPLLYYSPSYDGKTLRLSVELLEIDKIGKDNIKKLGNGLRSLSRLAIFAPQLAYLALAPDVTEIARKLYNIINKNDLVLLEHIDLSFDMPDSNVLTSGRFVLVEGNHSSSFTKEFKLSFDNKLVTQAGAPAEQAGLTDAYVVLRINAKERDEYKGFEIDSATQQVLQQFLNQGVTEEIAEVLTESVDAAIRMDAVNTVLKLTKRLGRTTDDAKKEEFKKEIESNIKHLSEDQADLLRDALGI